MTGLNFGIKRSAADRLFSLLVRELAGWQCERCYKGFTRPAAGLHCSHFFGRGTKATRWDRDNTAALCVSCHQYVTENPSDHRDFFYKRLGKKKFEALEFRAKNVGKAPDEKLIAMALKAELKRMGVPIGRKGPAVKF